MRESYPAFFRFPGQAIRRRDRLHDPPATTTHPWLDPSAHSIRTLPFLESTRLRDCRPRLLSAPGSSTQSYTGSISRIPVRDNYPFFAKQFPHPYGPTTAPDDVPFRTSTPRSASDPSSSSTIIPAFPVIATPACTACPRACNAFISA
jgi:hypothetical protein